MTLLDMGAAELIRAASQFGLLLYQDVTPRSRDVCVDFPRVSGTKRARQ